jgi:outer membrane protein assembly factor BamB
VFCSNSTPFLEEGTIYGVGCNQGELAAVDLATGKGLWQTFAATTGDRNAGHATAFLVKHGDRFFLFNDQGDLILATLTREKYEELGRFHVLEPTNEGLGRSVVWSHPAFANKCLYARNDKELVCVSLAKE